MTEHLICIHDDLLPYTIAATRMPMLKNIAKATEELTESCIVPLNPCQSLCQVLNNPKEECSGSYELSCYGHIVVTYDLGPQED